MRYINSFKKTSILILVGIVIILITSFAIYRSLKIIYANTKKEIRQQNVLQVNLISENLKNYLITNKNLLDSIISAIPNSKPETLEKFLNQYLFKVEHEHIKNLFFISDKGILLIYPHLSKTLIPINYIKQNTFLYKKVELAKSTRKSLYFRALMLNLSNKPKNSICLLLVHPLFINGKYKGSIVESIDIGSKLSDIFKYFRNYSINLSYKPIRTKNIQET